MRRLLIFLFALQPLFAQTYFGPVNDPYVSTRVAPGVIGTQPVMPTWVAAPLQVGINQDLYSAFKSTYSAQLVNGWINVDTVAGNDSTCTVNTTKPCATVFEALRLKVDSFIYVKCPAGGTYTAPHNTEFDFRFTDGGYGNGVKMLMFDVPCHLIFPGDTIASNTWTATGGHAGMYQTTLSCYPTTCGGVNSIQRTDQSDGCTTHGLPCTDEWGNAFPDRLYSALPAMWDTDTTYQVGQYAWNGSYVLYQAIHSNVNSSPPNSNWTTLGTGSANWDTAGLANLDLLPEGWYFSPNTSVLYCKLNGLDLTQPANAAKIRARYWQQGNYPLSASGSNPRVFVYGTKLYVSNVYLDGFHFETNEYNNSGTWMPGSIWAENCTVFNSWSYGALVRGGTWDRFQNCVNHANQSDGWNADIAADGTTASNMERIFVKGSWAGDPHSYVSGILASPYPNNNGESSHNSLSVDIGGHYFQNYGPDCADTSNAAVANSQSWEVATVCEDISPFNGPPYITAGNPGGFQMQGLTSPGDSRNRQFWLDTTFSANETLLGVPYAVSLTNGAVCHVYNSTYDTPVALNNANGCTGYTPNAP